VEEPDLARAVPGAEQVQVQPPLIAARGGCEEPASIEAGQASQATRQAEEELGMQPCGDEPRRTCSRGGDASDIRDVGRCSGSRNR
jgi:hypothetical protein